ncbi:MAG: bifunctional homocysteine S-methyltransferase/methylenetetrahydrofolate reductase [Anaerolineae bacterium]|nr:bifunctional homocysteine S-methyltransferase/methylenetetrahydrofolate reductase [Thermoflexales bacterium]MDW8407669.1 bifunctional homocysteine S-methyltransferase/methylenetetrahydrofolate reductase [Anaerolineae bacterium]
MNTTLTLLERLRQTPLLADGAMGTMLYAHGVGFDECFDALNLNRPEIVAEIHREYARAGADIIETNTFGANAFKLAEHRLQDRVVEINQRGVEIAREAVRPIRPNILIAGSVGPLGRQLAPLGSVKPEEARAAFAEQSRALAEAGVDLIILETFSDLNEIEQAVRAAQTTCTLPIVAHMTFTRDDRTLLGNTPAEVVTRLQALGVQVIGANCSTGPRRMLDVISAMREALEQHEQQSHSSDRACIEDADAAHKLICLSAMPNAGFPERRGERVMYPATPDYFAEYARRFLEAGARLIGGCCGTTPDHIRAMRRAIDSWMVQAGAGQAQGEASSSIVLLDAPRQTPTPASAPVAFQPTQLAQALAQREFVITVEVEPPKGNDTAQVEETAHMLREAGATVLDISDLPMARMRMSALAVAHRIQERAGVETVLHFPVRGRNLLRVQGDLLAAHALNIRNVFVVMGDPTSIGDYPQANDHHDIVPTGLAQLIKTRLNQGLDSAGSSIGRPCAFFIGVAVNLTPTDFDKEAALLRKKIDSGADFALSQPVFDAARACAFIEHYIVRYGTLTLPILAGLLPLASARHAEFLRNEVPGMFVPDVVVERLQAAGKQGRAEGMRIALETLDALRNLTQGVYIIPSFGRYDAVAGLIRDIRRA